MIEKKKVLSGGDLILLVVILMLLGLGISVLFSASYFRAAQIFGTPLYFFERQVLWAIISLICSLIVYFIPIYFIRRALPILVLVSLVFMILTFIPNIGTELQGGRRWFIIAGMSFQPSELVKLTIVIYLAHILEIKMAYDDSSQSQLVLLLQPIILNGLFLLLIFLQKDFSTTFFTTVIVLCMFFIAGVKKRYFVLFGAGIIPIALLMIVTQSYRMQRILTFFDPNRDPINAGYQILASLRALSQGGMWGTGIGQGDQKLGGLPEAHSDFIFAVLGEEIGFWGIVLTLGLFAVFAYRGYSIAWRSEDNFSLLLAFGITTLIIGQAFTNIAVVSGLLPTTGIALPFFSSGGSSLLLTMIMSSLLLNISKNISYDEGI